MQGENSGSAEEIYNALVSGLCEYAQKHGFKKAVTSGGIDSSVTAAIAAAALGKQNVLAVLMPGPFSSKGSVEDAKIVAKNLGIKHTTIPINEIYESYIKTLKNEFKGKKFDKTEENIQARIRGNILMAFSNKFGYLVLSTGNKSELSVGYCTLYGDMGGGLAVIGDIYKTLVYEIAHYINSCKEIIPRHVLEKPPSAELKPWQKDSDDLPEYEILDKILHAMLEEKKSKDEIAGMGYDRNIVERIASMVEKAGYKRRQASPCLKIAH